MDLNTNNKWDDLLNQSLLSHLSLSIVVMKLTKSTDFLFEIWRIPFLAT